MTAARVAYLFKLDPVEVMAADPVAWQVRAASANVIIRDIRPGK